MYVSRIRKPKTSVLVKKAAGGEKCKPSNHFRHRNGSISNPISSEGTVDRSDRG